MMKAFVAALFLSLALAAQARNIRPRAAFKTGAGRILNGEDALPGEFPFQVGFFTAGSFHCGGSIIDDDVVLSAAHCTFETAPGIVTLYAGSNTLGEGQERTVSEVKWHEDFNWVPAMANDVGILILTEPWDMSDANVGIVALSDFSQDGPDTFANEEGTIIGWGRNEQNLIQDQLQKAGVDILTREECQAYDGASINEAHICILDLEDTQSACNGDSGGPLLVMNSDGSYMEIGTASWVGTFPNGDCDPGQPSVYNSVAAYRDWILTNGGV